MPRFLKFSAATRTSSPFVSTPAIHVDFHFIIALNLCNCGQTFGEKNSGQVPEKVLNIRIVIRMLSLQKRQPDLKIDLT